MGKMKKWEIKKARLEGGPEWLRILLNNHQYQSPAPLLRESDCHHQSWVEEKSELEIMRQIYASTKINISGKN